MKTIVKSAKILSVLCLLGAVTALLALHLCSSKTGVFNGKAQTAQMHTKEARPAVDTGFSCSENTAQANTPANNNQESKSSIPADLGITRVLTPIISEYLSSLLPRLLP